ncbi:MAG TPA: ribosomal protein S18-alanine N-acetyltransferase [Kofleriaceae bacterium]|nr:ribosomal protein S18-alanine N-acetyltransferase [Kofleriaceae bacterium]
MRVERVRDPAGDPDIDAIVSLEVESFTNPWSRDTLVWELRNSDVTQVFILRDDRDEVLAFCVCWVIFDELHINTLAVAPAARRGGRATFLLRAVMAEAARAGATKATLEVRASNQAALGLYDRLGFRVAAQRPRYYTRPEEDALILWRDSLDTSP